MGWVHLELSKQKILITEQEVVADSITGTAYSIMGYGVSLVTGKKDLS